jgi:hypothetical protein
VGRFEIPLFPTKLLLLDLAVPSDFCVWFVGMFGIIGIDTSLVPVEK